MARGVCVGAVVALLAAAPAQAARVQLVEESLGKGSARWAEYTAAPGETNDLTVTFSKSGTIFIDAGAELRAGRGCFEVDPERVLCPEGTPRVYLGDGDDRTGGSAGAAYHAGDGNDTIRGTGSLRGEAGDDVLHGGDRNDSIDGGAGRDRSSGGGGDDSFGDPMGSDGLVGPERDVVDGGPGQDAIAYARSTPVEVDLARGLGGDPRGEDTLTSIERAYSQGGGVLSGSEAANRLHAFGGTTFRGRGGDDQIFADEDARDRIDAGTGNDVVDLDYDWEGRPRPTPDELHCGSGTDTVTDPSPIALLPVDCERADFDLDGVPVMRLSRWALGQGFGSVTFLLEPCFEARCHAWAELRRVSWPDRDRPPRLGPLLASARHRDAREGSRMTLRPTPLGRRLRATGRCVKVVLRLGGDSPDVHALHRTGRACAPSAPPRP